MTEIKLPRTNENKVNQDAEKDFDKIYLDYEVTEEI